MAVRDGALPRPDAIRFFQQLMSDKAGSVSGWHHAATGIAAQVRNGELSLAELARFIVNALRKRHEPYRGGLLVITEGLVDGQPRTVTVSTPLSGPSTYLWQSMATATGTAVAAFMDLALQPLAAPRRGVLCPEDWVSPQAFYDALRHLGVPNQELPRKSVVQQLRSLR